MEKWPLAKLKDVCESIIDCINKTAPISDEKTNYKMIRTTNVRSGQVDTSSVRYVTFDTYEKWTRRSVPQKGDVILTRKAPLGEVGIIATNDNIFLGQRLVQYRANPQKLDKFFLLYALQTKDVKAQLKKLGAGSTVEHVSVPDCEKITIPLPPLEEQKRISAIARKCDRLRRTRRFIQQLSDTYLQSVFLEMFGEHLSLNVKTILSDFLEIPLSNGVFEKNDKYGSGTPVIWVDNLYHTSVIDISNLRRANLDQKSVKKYEVFEGDLLFTRSSLVREGTGQINIVPPLQEPTTFECHTIRARVKKEAINPYYLLGLYRSSFGRDLIMLRANTATMTTIGQDAIANLLCPVPPLHKQDTFAKIVCRSERLRVQQREAERQAEHLFQTILHRAFRGEL